MRIRAGRTSILLPRIPAGLTLLSVIVSCSLTTPVQKPEIVNSLSGSAIANSVFKVKDVNLGRLVGTLTVTPEILKWAGVPDLSTAVAQAFDPDGTALDAKVTLDASGHFLISGLTISRSVIFVEADVNGLRFRAVTVAPRLPKDYPVVLDAGSTYLADKLRRADLDQNVDFQGLNPTVLEQTTQVVDAYLKDPQAQQVLEQTNPDLNAYSFDHFMDRNEPVKQAVYLLGAGILRGWTPPPSSPIVLTPSPLPTDEQPETPTPSLTPTPFQTPPK